MPAQTGPLHFAAKAKPRWDVPVSTIGGLPIAVIDCAQSAELMVDAALARRDAGQPPLVDYYRAPEEPANAALKMLFLRICLFAAFESCFETLFTQVGTLWAILIIAAFGLRFLSVSRVSR